MTAPDRIWIAEDEIGDPWWTTAGDDDMDEYIRADPAVILAAALELPEVKALVEAYKRGATEREILQSLARFMDAALAALKPDAADAAP